MTVIENDSPKEFFEGPFEVSDLIPFTFPYADRTDVKVKIGDEAATYGVEYEVSAESPSSILVKVNIDDGVQVTVYRETPIDQQSNYPQNSKFRSEQVESDFDKICMIQQEQKETLTRCLRMAIDTASAFDGLLPASSAGKALMWNSDGEITNTPFTMTELQNSVNTAVSNSATALAKSTEAMTIAGTAEQKLTTALSNSTTALADSATAVATATSAMATATSASDTATSAMATATLASNKVDSLETAIPTATSDLINDSGFITGIDYTAVTTALGYIPQQPLSQGNGIVINGTTISVATTIASKTDIVNMQTTTNLVTSVSSSSTDSQYPSAKLFYDTCGDIETLINAL